MKLDERGNQKVENADLVNMSEGPHSCRCGRWILIRLRQGFVCSGCEFKPQFCVCEPAGDCLSSADGP